MCRKKVWLCFVPFWWLSFGKAKLEFDLYPEWEVNLEGADTARSLSTFQACDWFLRFRTQQGIGLLASALGWFWLPLVQLGRW